jgi:thiamine-triphosphatase
MLKCLPRTRSLLEVERKFRSLAVSELTKHGGSPPFQTLRSLESQKLHDIYYDRSNLLLSAGVWVRNRNGQWQAKVKKGGNFTNSMFEELSGALAISSFVRQFTGCSQGEAESFGLEPTANILTNRASWLADDRFRIVVDVMDFGHTVGEVELQQLVELDAGTTTSIEEQKRKMMQEMDEKIAAFMKRYSWAFSPGDTKGKLSAYFERKSKLSSSE